VSHANQMNKLPDIRIVQDHQTALASEPSVQWAKQTLIDTLESRGMVVAHEQVEAKQFAKVQIIISGNDSSAAIETASELGVALPEEAESLAILAAQGNIVLTAPDGRGLVYALLELTDRIQHASGDIIGELLDVNTLIDKPANEIRSVTRLFACEPEDKPWFYDKSFWDEYLTELATQRFNRFTLSLGMGYDYGHDPNVRDNYFCFAYPFLFDVPGYEVKVLELSEEERRLNYETLHYIGQETKRRGMHFQLGLWNHSYLFTDSPNMDYTIAGIDEKNHAAYCRDAIRKLLKEYTEIDGLTFRVHYEGGIPEPAYEFWRVALEGTKDIGRRVDIDMHAKGINDELIQIALDTRQPIFISPKYWAEHMGPSYHQAAIRDNEFSLPKNQTMDMQAITAWSRRFTRYGYADYLQDDRKIGILFRLWPGTQKLLLWGDPALAAGYGRHSHFSGTQGIELCEPLTFKGRKGSGSEGGREPYLAEELKLPNRDWLKYKYTYRLWGRLLYNPETNPDVWRRYLRFEFGEAADSYELALAHASRILPLVTAAYCPSAANVVYWPEMHTNQPIADPDLPSPFGFDTPKPGTFGAASPLDTALFYRVDDFADDITQGFRHGKYSPLETADRLESMATTAAQYLAKAVELAEDPQAANFQRFVTDTRMLVHIGQFFANKFRAALSYALSERTGDTAELERALDFYKLAREHWVKVVAISQDKYEADISFGYTGPVRGHWADRLPAIEADIQAMERQLQTARVDPSRTVDTEKLQAAMRVLTASPVDRRQLFVHQMPSYFTKGEKLGVLLELPGASDGLKVVLHYRHANQSEHYVVTEMKRDGASFAAEIPAAYTESPFGILYFFEVVESDSGARLYPGLNEDISNQPYYFIQSR
jgi:hypothetical protein